MANLMENLLATVGFLNVAVHDYQKMNLNTLRSIPETNPADFTDFTQAIRKAS